MTNTLSQELLLIVYIVMRYVDCRQTHTQKNVQLAEDQQRLKEFYIMMISYSAMR